MSAIYEDLRGKTVLITGGAGGIGEGITEAFAAQGCQTVILDKDADAGARLADRYDNVWFHPVDLCDEPALVHVLESVQQQHGAPHALINNAGWDPRYDFTQMTMDQWDHLFRLNVGHYFVTCRELLPGMIDHGGGSIVMTSSIEFFLGDDKLACYTATKGAILGMVKSLAREVGRHMIRVNAVAPGWVMTERQMRELVTEEAKKKLLEEWQCMPFLLKPEHLAPAFVFLAAEASKGITRHTMVVDAGFARH